MATKESKTKESKEMAKYEPARALSPFEQIERQFEQFFGRPFSLLGPSWWPARRIFGETELAPSVDIYEENGDVVLKAEMPGIKKDDVEVNITDHTVTISAEKKKEEKVEDKDFYRHERSYGSPVNIRGTTAP